MQPKFLVRVQFSCHSSEMSYIVSKRSITVIVHWNRRTFAVVVEGDVADLVPPVGQKLRL